MQVKMARNRQDQTQPASVTRSRGIRLRRFIHPVLIKLLSMHRSFSLHMEGTIPKEPCIFTVNHQGVDDIPTAGEVIRKHSHVLVSDEDKTTSSGLLFKMNGVIWVYRKNKTDRNRAKRDVIYFFNHTDRIQKTIQYPPFSTDGANHLVGQGTDSLA